MRVFVLGLFLVGCYAPKIDNGAIKCNNNACPSGFHCASDNTCWKNGQDPSLPDLALPGQGNDLGSAADLANSTGDLAQTAMVPDAPSNVTASSGDASATVSWTAPNDHGNAITGYTVTSSPGGVTAMVGGTTLSTTVSGLTNGVTYTFTLTATNSVGTGPASAPSNAVTPLAAATAPAAPTAPTATISQPLAATVTWTAPDNHGSTITGYTITSSPGNVTKSAPGTATSATVSGLVAGTTYVFTVTATNGVGTGPASPPSNSVTAADVPTAPGNVTAQANVPGGATVSWTAASAPGSAVSRYNISWSGGQQIVSGSATQAVIQMLTAGQSYTFTVTATDAVGTGPAGMASTTIVDVPTAPTNVTASANVSKGATISWTASNANGSAIQYYTVTSSGGQSVKTANGATTTAVMTGLTVGTAYTFTVTATNGFGTSPSSTASNTIVVADVPGAPGNVAANANVAKGATVTWTAPNSNGSAITGYNVHWTPGAGTSPTQPASATQYTVTGLTAGTTYTFTVTATNAIGTGPASSGANATILDIPSTPGGFAACAQNGAVQMVWNSSTSASSYNIYYSTTSGGELSGVKIPNVTSPYTLTGLSNGTTYYLEVTAANKVGESSPSTEQFATPTTNVHNALFVGVTNTNAVDIYDCYSLLGNTVTTPSRTLTLPTGLSVAGEGGLAIDAAANTLYVGISTTNNGGEILAYHNAGTISGAATPDITATGVFNDVNGNAPSTNNGVDGIVLDTTRGILYADNYGYFTMYTTASSLTGRVPFHDATYGNLLGHGSQMAFDTGANTLYMGQLSTVGGTTGVWNVSVFPNLSAVAAPATGYATMPTPTKQITLASPNGYNKSAGTLGVAIDTTNDLLYVTGSNSSATSNVFTTTLSTAGANSPVTDTIAFADPAGIYGPYAIWLTGTELWTLGSGGNGLITFYDITSANTANGKVGTTITPAKTINVSASTTLGGVLYVP